MKSLCVVLLLSLAIGCSSKSKDATSASSEPAAKPRVEATPTATPASNEKAQKSSDKQMIGLVANNEWVGQCRKVVNESGKVVDGQAQLRLQTSYSFFEKSVRMLVTSFGDPNCNKALEVNTFEYACDSSPERKLAKCKTVKRYFVSSSEERKEMPLIDSKGNSSVSEVQFSVRYLKGNKAVLRTIDESGDERNDTLFLKTMP